MRRIIILAILFLCSVNILGQDNARHLERALDYINARITYLMLTEYLKTDQSSRNNWEPVKKVLETNTVENVVSYPELSKTLKGSFGATLRKLSDPIASIGISRYLNADNRAASESMVDEAFRILQKSYPAIYPAVESQRPALMDDVMKMFPVTVEKSESVQEKETTPVDNMIAREQEAGFFSLQYVDFWTLLAVFLALAAIGLSATAINKYIDQDKKPGNARRDEYIEASSVGWKDFQQYKNHIETKISEINTALGNISLEIRKNEVTSYHNDKQVHTPAVVKETEERQDVFYMSSPSNNYFPVSAKAQQKENTLYRFILSANRNEAQFEVINDGAPVAQAANHASAYLEPACNAENSPGSVVNRIVTVKPGKASFDGEKWIINYKAEIRYE